MCGGAEPSVTAAPGPTTYGKNTGATKNSSPLWETYAPDRTRKMSMYEALYSNPTLFNTGAQSYDPDTGWQANGGGVSPMGYAAEKGIAPTPAMMSGADPDYQKWFVEKMAGSDPQKYFNDLNVSHTFNFDADTGLVDVYNDPKIEAENKAFGGWGTDWIGPAGLIAATAGPMLAAWGAAGGAGAAAAGSTAAGGGAAAGTGAGTNALPAGLLQSEIGPATGTILEAGTAASGATSFAAPGVSTAGLTETALAAGSGLSSLTPGPGTAKTLFDKAKEVAPLVSAGVNLAGTLAGASAANDAIKEAEALATTVTSAVPVEAQVPAPVVAQGAIEPDLTAIRKKNALLFGLDSASSTDLTGGKAGYGNMGRATLLGGTSRMGASKR